MVIEVDDIQSAPIPVADANAEQLAVAHVVLKG